MKGSARKLAQGLRTRKRWLKRAFWTLVVLVFAGLFGARPAAHAWRERQATKEIVSARAAIAEEDWPRALVLVQSAVRHAPRNAEVVRAVADVQIGIGDHPDNIVQTFERLIELQQATNDDYLKLARAHLDRGDVPAVQTALNMVPLAERQTWKAVELETDLLMRLDRIPEAEHTLQQALKANPQDEEVRFKLAVVDFTSGNDQRRDLGRQVLWQFARSGGGHAMVAMNLLSGDRVLTAVDAIELLRLVEKKTGLAGLGLRYRATAALIRSRPHERERLLQAEQDKAARTDASSQVLFLQFLAAVGESQRILDFVTAHGALLRQQRPGDYWNFRLEGLARVNAWAQVIGEMKQAPAQAIVPVMMHLWQACAASEIDRNEHVVRDHLEQGFKAAGEGRDMTVAMQIADTAARLNQHELAAAYFEQIASVAPMPADRVAMLQRGLESRLVLRDTVRVASLARKIADHMPGNYQSAFRADYLHLLAGAAVESVVTRLTQMESEALSADLKAHHRLLWAMVFQRRGQKDLISKQVSGLADAASWQAGERAVIAGLLAESGDTASAFRLAEKVPAALLLKEEAALLAKAK